MSGIPKQLDDFVVLDTGVTRESVRDALVDSINLAWSIKGNDAMIATSANFVALLIQDNDRLRAERLKLDRRIHNQRSQNRQTWETIEMRAGYKRLPEEVRSRMLKGWCAANKMCFDLRERLRALGQ